MEAGWHARQRQPVEQLGEGRAKVCCRGGGVDRCAWRGRKLARTRMLGNVNLSDMGQHLAVTFCTYNLYQKQGKGGQGEF